MCSIRDTGWQYSLAAALPVNSVEWNTAVVCVVLLDELIN